MIAIKNLFGSILIAIAIFIFWVVILPEYDGRVYLESIVRSRSADFEAKSKLIDRVEELDKEYQSRYAELKRLALVVPEAKHLEEMITIWEDMFSLAGVPLKDMNISAQDDQVGSPYNLVTMEFNLRTSNDSVINFLNSLEKSIRLIDITELTVGVTKDEIIPGESTMLQAVIKAKAYFLSKAFKAKSDVRQPSASEE